MLIVQGYRDAPAAARGAVLAIGNFDGVHRGHQALLAVTREQARKAGKPAGVILFEPHPREFFQPDRPHFRLTPLPLKLQLLDRFGLDLAIAPGQTKYPDLTSVGFPSVLEANGLTRMPMIEFDQTYSNLFDQCCVDTHFSHNLLTYSSATLARCWVQIRVPPGSNL